MTKLYTIALTAVLLAVATAPMHTPNSITRCLPSVAPLPPRPGRSRYILPSSLSRNSAAERYATRLARASIRVRASAAASCS